MRNRESLSKAKKKWERNAVEHVTLRVPKGKKQKIQECADMNNESINGMINRLLDNELNRLMNNISNK